ncbi:13533_t:CDS:2, partial [Dentiscutata heterogama]
IQNLMPTPDMWTKIKEILILMEPLERATKLLSATSYPTIMDIRFLFSGIQEYLEGYVKDRQETTDVVNKAREVFNQYHTTLTNKQAYNLHINKDDISTTCNYFK